MNGKKLIKILGVVASTGAVIGTIITIIAKIKDILAGEEIDANFK